MCMEHFQLMCIGVRQQFIAGLLQLQSPFEHEHIAAHQYRH